MTGAVDRFRAAFMVATDVCARSMRTPSRFSSRTTLCGDTGRGGEGPVPWARPLPHVLSRWHSLVGFTTVPREV